MSDVTSHDGDVSRRERRSHGLTLLPPGLAIAERQAAPDDRAQNAPPKRKSCIVLSLGHHDVTDRFGCARKNEDLACGSKLHDRLVNATRWERGKGVATQSR